MANKPRAKMPISERAKQFMPFSALRGLNEALAEKEKIYLPKKELSEEMAEDLNAALKQISPTSVVTVIYYQEGTYHQITGVNVWVDEYDRLLRMMDMQIPFDDLFEVKVEEDISDCFKR